MEAWGQRAHVISDKMITDSPLATFDRIILREKPVVLHRHYPCPGPRSLLEYFHRARVGQEALATVQLLAEYSTSPSIVIKAPKPPGSRIGVFTIPMRMSIFQVYGWPLDFDVIDGIFNSIRIRPFIGLQALQPPQIPGSQ